MTRLVLVCLLFASAAFAQPPGPPQPDDVANSSPASAAVGSPAADQPAGQPSDQESHPDLGLLRRRPVQEVSTAANPSSPTFHPSVLYGNEPLPAGMVWVPAGKVWAAREINSCQWCAKPMTFKQAAFDRKAVWMWGTALAMTVADIEVMSTRRCTASGTCTEGNPFLGQSRAQQYGIRIPVLAGAWVASAMLRKGNSGRNIGGMKRWWLIPAAYQALSTAGVVANLAR